MLGVDVDVVGFVVLLVYDVGLECGFYVIEELCVCLWVGEVDFVY